MRDRKRRQSTAYQHARLRRSFILRDARASMSDARPPVHGGLDVPRDDPADPRRHAMASARSDQPRSTRRARRDRPGGGGSVDAILGAMGLEVPPRVRRRKPEAPAARRWRCLPPRRSQRSRRRRGGRRRRMPPIASRGPPPPSASHVSIEPPRSYAAVVGLTAAAAADSAAPAAADPHPRRRRSRAARVAVCVRIQALDRCNLNYACLARNSPWNFAIRSPTRSIWSSGGRKVVRKCHVPAFWPKPEPGTTTMPVFSRRCIA